MFDKIKKAFKKDQPAKKKPSKKKSAMDIATENGEAYVNVIGMDVNPENIQDGAFELEWNDLFLAKLVKQGYQEKKDETDAEIVDRWFQTICRGVAQETYEQYQADPDNRRDLGNGYTEVK